ELWRFNFGAAGYHLTAFSADGRTLAACDGGQARLFDPAGKPVGTFALPLRQDESVTSLLPSPDGGRILLRMVARHERLVLWDRAAGKPAWATEPEFGPVGQYTSSPDGRSLVRFQTTLATGLVNAADGKDGPVFEEWPEFDTAAAFRPDGRVVALGHNAGTISLFDPATGKPVPPRPDPPGEVNSLRFSPDGKTLFGNCGGWLSWDVATGAQ